MSKATQPKSFFIGQVPPNWTEYLQNGTWDDAHNNRVKVRIPGKQSQGPEVLDQDLPWAIVAQSTSAGNRNGTSTGLSGGEWVIGFYLDENEQLPVIMQVLGKNEVSGAKIKASENGTTRFKDVSRFNSSLVAQAHQITGGPRRNPNGPAVPSKEDFNDALASTETPPEQPEGFVGFPGGEEAAAEAQAAREAREAEAIRNIPEPTGDAIDLSDATRDTRTPAQIQADSAAQRQRIIDKIGEEEYYRRVRANENRGFATNPDGSLVTEGF